MPMKWTHDQDKLLIVMLLETHSFSVDHRAMVEAWPGPEKPTPKALSERISKMRKDIKTKLPINGATTTTTTSTIKKTATRAPRNKPVTNTLKASKSAKRTHDSEDSEDEPPAKKGATGKKVLNREVSPDSGTEDISPRRKAALAAQKTFKLKLEDDEDVGGGSPMPFDVDDTTSNEYHDPRGDEWRTIR